MFVARYKNCVRCNNEKFHVIIMILYLIFRYIMEEELIQKRKHVSDGKTPRKERKQSKVTSATPTKRSLTFTSALSPSQKVSV